MAARRLSLRRACAAALAGAMAMAAVAAPTPAAATTAGALERAEAGSLSGRAPRAEAIEVMPLDSVDASAVGVLTAEQTGIPRDIWGAGDPETIARLLRPYRPARLPEITAFWHRLALTESIPPPFPGAGETLLLARVDHLLEAGALEQAEALLQAAGHLSPELFARAFDVGLLTGRVEEACATLHARPALSPGIAARVFCLARQGDWDAAALTLRTAEALGRIGETEAALLARFLDPEEFEEDPVPRRAGPITALDFVIREALGLPREPGTLPLAFLHVDLAPGTPWRDRLMAAERLARAQAIQGDRLLDLYREGTPAASGGLWARARAVRALHDALEGGPEEAVGPALLEAHAALQEAGLGFVLAELAATDARDVEMDGAAAGLRFELWLISPQYAELAWDHEPADPREALLRAVALGQAAEAPAAGPRAAAVLSGLSGVDNGSPLLWEVAQGRRGEAILKALTVLVESQSEDPRAVETALSVLTRAGLAEEARRIALQALLAAEGRL